MPLALQNFYFLTVTGKPADYMPDTMAFLVPFRKIFFWNLNKKTSAERYDSLLI